MTYDTYPTASRDDYDVIVLGAGHNGMVAAAKMARGGLRVLVLEQRHIVGGAVATEELFPGYRFSTCAAYLWLLQPAVIEELCLWDHGLKLQKPDPDPFFLFEDRVGFGQGRHLGQTQAAVARLNAEDARRLPEHAAFWNRAAELVRPFQLRHPPTEAELWAHADAIGERKLLEQLKRTSVGEIAAEFFKDPRIQAVYSSVEDLGDPWAPGNAWPSVFFRTGAFVDVQHEFVVGGMGALANALALAGVEHGVEFELNAKVTKILTRGGEGVEGVELADGRTFRAPRVVSNAHQRVTMAMIDELRPRIEELTGHWVMEAASTKFHCVMRRPPDITEYGSVNERDAASLRIQLSLEHFRDSFRSAQAGELPTAPTVGAFAVQSLYDSTVADGPYHTVSLWTLYAPVRLAQGTWETRREEAAERLIDWVDRFVPNFREDIVDYVLYTPADLESRISMLDGAIHHVDVVKGQTFETRDGYDGPIPGLYYCGSGVHGGGEVSGLSGYNAANWVLQQVERAG
ncbi:MAG TPA: NAD(P)/FAD-dependent oxidoreductase [Conexibacter sp.]|nr:NAD(P)/FAD-dependent oxidoreductase [Conexibacter sp.]